MALRTAAKLCPHAIFLDSHHELYGQWSDRVATILGKYSPIVEMASIDEAYLDLAGTERLLGPPLAAAHRLLREITATTSLPCSGGLGATRLVAKIASEQAKPQGLVWIPAGSEAAFLAPLAVRRVPGIGKVTDAALRALGIETIAQLQAVPLERLESTFGQWGTALFRKARGIDSYEFFVDAEPKSISHNQTFGEDTRDRGALESTLSYLCQKASKRMRDAGLHARTITLTLRYAQPYAGRAFGPRHCISEGGRRTFPSRVGRQGDATACRRCIHFIFGGRGANRLARSRAPRKTGTIGAGHRPAARPLRLFQGAIGRLASRSR
jgi:DNA polymerase-4